MTNVIVVIGAGSIGQAIARRISAGKHVLLADLKQENADAAAKVVQHVMPGAALRQVGGLAKIRIVLGTDGNTVTGASASTGQGTASGSSVTAAQYACS